MKNFKDLNQKEKDKQQLYELGQFGMYNILKELECKKLYEKPILIGLLDTLIAAVFKKFNNDEKSITAIGNITATYLNNNKTKH